jgi:hypothetical protein
MTRHLLTRLCLLVPSIMVAWGLVMTLMCLVNSYTGLIMSVRIDNTRIEILIFILQRSSVPGSHRSWIVCGQVLQLGVCTNSVV